MIIFGKEKIGNRRIITICGLKIKYKKKFIEKPEKREIEDKVEFLINFQTICNYNCVFCVNDKVENKLLKTSDLKDFSCICKHAKNVDITGYGEPTLNPEFPEIIKRLNEYNVPIGFTTNGSLLKKEYAELLVNSNIEYITFSINSLNPETYKKLHNNNADLNTVISNLDYLISLNPNFPIRLTFVLNSYNFNEIPNFIEFAKKRKPHVSLIHCFQLTPTLKHIYDNDLLIVANEENKKYIKDMLMLGKKEGVNVSIGNLNYSGTGEYQIDDVQLRNMIKGCEWVYQKCSIGIDGKVIPCCWASEDLDLGNIQEESFKKIWYGEKYNAFRKLVSKGDTTYCHNCRRLG